MDECRPAEPRPAWRRRLAVLAPLAGAAGALAFLGGLASGAATSTFLASGALVLYRPSANFFCSRCHPNIVRAWRASTHADARCADCHSREGSLGFWSENLYAAHITAVAVNGRYRDLVPFRTQVSDTACLKCHRQAVYGRRSGRWIAGLSDPLTWRGRPFTHRQLFLAGYKCTQCHSTVVEGDLVPPGSRTYPHLPAGWPAPPASPLRR